jgi:hypothetical protein
VVILRCRRYLGQPYLTPGRNPVRGISPALLCQVLSPITLMPPMPFRSSHAWLGPLVCRMRFDNAAGLYRKSGYARVHTYWILLQKHLIISVLDWSELNQVFRHVTDVRGWMPYESSP